jgi:hypothetical protein
MKATESMQMDRVIAALGDRYNMIIACGKTGGFSSYKNITKSRVDWIIATLVCSNCKVTIEPE